jgi:hypothetical protein
MESQFPQQHQRQLQCTAQRDFGYLYLEKTPCVPSSGEQQMVLQHAEQQRHILQHQLRMCESRVGAYLIVL